MFSTEFRQMVPQYLRQCGVAGVVTTQARDWTWALWPGRLVWNKARCLGFFGHQSLVKSFTEIFWDERDVGEFHMSVCCLEVDVHEQSQLVGGDTKAYVMGFVFQGPALSEQELDSEGPMTFALMLGDAAAVLAHHGPFLAMGDAGPWPGDVVEALKEVAHGHVCRICDGPVTSSGQNNNGLWIVGSHGKISGPNRLGDDHEDWSSSSTWMVDLRVTHNDLETACGEPVLAGQPTVFVGRAPRMRVRPEHRSRPSHSWSR